MSLPFRCSAASRERLEPLEGTASTVRAFLLVEAPGPWGVDAVRECRMDEEVRGRLLELERRHRVRPLLIRRHGRGGGDGTRVFAVHVDRDRPWAETVRLADPRELLDLDLTGLREGRSPGLTEHEEPVFCVCTHGRHDACCAEQGRPLASAMSALAPGQTWEVSHIGGDRFAANVLVLPHGLYYGRLV
ncbi:MAG TPA: sucrase ferredoxin, partial [Nocardioidaceae bacterium]